MILLYKYKNLIEKKVYFFVDFEIHFRYAVINISEGIGVLAVAWWFYLSMVLGIIMFNVISIYLNSDIGKTINMLYVVAS